VGWSFFGFFILIFVIPFAHAEPIAITISDGMEKVIFDGRWTFAKEWKQSSLETIHTESNAALIHIRTAHLNNFIYVMLNAVSDKTIDFNQDEATVCFDSNYNQNSKTQSNAYCFVIKLGSDKPVTLQSTDNSKEFIVVENHIELIAVADSSDENDRYSKVPHATYEFRIPIELIDRTDRYGFFVKVFDFSNSMTYTWPPEIVLESNSDIPSPAKWGLIYSPDKSLPEYDLPILVLILGTLSAVILSSKIKKINLFYLNR